MKTKEDRSRKIKQRAKGTGAIITLPSGMYAFQYRAADGKKKTKSLKTRNRKEAEEKAKPLAAMVSAQDQADAVKGIAKARELIDNGSLPLGDVWEEFMLTRPTAGAGTLKLYERIFKQFTVWLKAKYPETTDFADVDEAMAKAWLIDVWADGISASTFNDKRGALQTITKALVQADKIKSNPWRKTAAKKAVKQQRREALSPEQAQALIEVQTTKENHALLMLALFGGLRLKDAALLKWECVKGRTIQYIPAKTERTSEIKATVPILPPLQAALDALPREGDYVLPETAESYQRRTETIKSRVLKLVQGVTGTEKNESNLGLVNRSKYGYHSLRHTFATEAARAGATAAELQSMTGDTMQTLGKYYLAVKIDERPNQYFANIRRLASGQTESEREELMRLADELPLAEVKRILKMINAKEGGAE
jgi:integrase